MDLDRKIVRIPEKGHLLSSYGFILIRLSRKLHLTGNNDYPSFPKNSTLRPLTMVLAVALPVSNPSRNT